MDHNLGIEDTANFDGWDGDAFDFMILDTPQMVLEKVKEKNELGFKARMLAGFAWSWTSEAEGNPNAEVKDVELSEYGFSMPWNSRSNQYSWAIDPEKVNQIGCVHTSQGLEFVGGGFFVRHSFLPMSLAWDAFGNNNGTIDYHSFSNAIHKYRRSDRRSEPDPTIGCIILTSPFFFERNDWNLVPDTNLSTYCLACDGSLDISV